MHAKRQAFITWSEVPRLKQEHGLDTNTPPQVNKGLGKEGGGGKQRRGDEWWLYDRWTSECVHTHAQI